MAGPKKTTSRSGAQNRPASVGPQTIFIPCNYGRNAYVFSTKTGKNPNLAVESPAFVAAVAENVENGQGAKVREELTALATRFPDHGWDATLERLENAGVLTA